MPTLPEPCECDRPLVDAGKCFKCGRSVIAAVTVDPSAANYRHAGEWPKRTTCDRCGAPVLKARHGGAGRPAILDVQEVSGYRQAELYLSADGIARVAPAGFQGRATGDAAHRRHRCGDVKAVPSPADDPGLSALAVAVGPPFAVKRLHRLTPRTAAA